MYRVRMRGWGWWWVNILDHCPVSCCVPEPSGDGTWVLDVVPYGGLTVTVTVTSSKGILY